ncbi:MAG: hypothetical protein PHD97_09100 [Bacteroidales bacterium]|nr:hypothetical protein [Bacteroidales bacterium]
MRISYTLALLFFCILVVAQQDYNSIMIKTWGYVNLIDSDSSYQTKTLTNKQFMEQMTDGGGSLTGYFKNGKLVKIKEQIGLSSCIITTEYYLKDNELIFVFTEGKEFLYVDSLKTFDSKTQTPTMTYKCFYKDGELIKKDLKGQTRCTGIPEDSWANMYQEECLRYINLLMKK